jgi:hypothetical protein
LFNFGELIDFGDGEFAFGDFKLYLATLLKMFLKTDTFVGLLGEQLTCLFEFNEAGVTEKHFAISVFC